MRVGEAQVMLKWPEKTAEPKVEVACGRCGEVITAVLRTDQVNVILNAKFFHTCWAGNLRRSK